MVPDRGMKGMMENMIMDQVLAAPLLRKLQAMQSQPYDNSQEADNYNNYIGPNSFLSDIHIHDHIHHDALLTEQALYQTMGHSMLPPSSSPLLQDAAINYLLANSAFPYAICKKEEEKELMLVSSLPSSDALLGSRHSLLSTNETHDFDSSYNTQLLHYASGGGSCRYSSELSSSYNTPLAEHVQCGIDACTSSRRYTSQPSLAYTHLASEDFSCLLKQSMKDEANCLGVDVQECHVKEVNKDASCLSCIMNTNNLHLALSTSSSSTPTSMTSGLTCHANVQGNWMTFDDNHNSNNPISTYPSNDKLLHMTNMVNNGDHNGVSASITSHEKKKKRKRKRTSHKNVEEMESQRMTHIAVERNRRKQMNEHLRALRMLMPHSYIQRGDQASIVGGTIRFVEELQQVLQALRLQKQIRSHQEYKIMNAKFDGDFGACMGQMHKIMDSHVEEAYASTRSCMANVEVTMMTSSEIFVKVLAQKRPHQLLHTLLALTNLSLKVTHLNVTATEFIILYCFNLKMEDDCQLHSSNELAESIQHIFCM